MRQFGWALGLIALLFAVAPGEAQVQSKPAPAAAAPPAGNTVASPRRGSALWKYRDCLKRYKDHEGCRYLAFRRKTH